MRTHSQMYPPTVVIEPEPHSLGKGSTTELYSQSRLIFLGGYKSTHNKGIPPGDTPLPCLPHGLQTLLCTHRAACLSLGTHAKLGSAWSGHLRPGPALLLLSLLSLLALSFSYLLKPHSSLCLLDPSVQLCLLQGTCFCRAPSSLLSLHPCTPLTQPPSGGLEAFPSLYIVASEALW